MIGSRSLAREGGGGGLYISQLLANPARLPRRFAGLFGFESGVGVYIEADSVRPAASPAAGA